LRRQSDGVWREFHIRQINHSCTREKGSVRGLHYQNANAPEAKLITCLRGEVWDVAVDLRPIPRPFCTGTPST
jgi:dTDP-4-dehydrorhamnose 3,5-epimerase